MSSAQRCMGSDRFSPVTDWVIGRAWGTIQQRSFSTRISMMVNLRRKKSRGRYLKSNLLRLWPLWFLLSVLLLFWGSCLFTDKEKKRRQHCAVKPLYQYRIWPHLHHDSTWWCSGRTYRRGRQNMVMLYPVMRLMVGIISITDWRWGSSRLLIDGGDHLYYWLTVGIISITDWRW